ncbi:MAG: sulfatase family protein [Actinomycetota bacterium]
MSNTVRSALRVAIVAALSLACTGPIVPTARSAERGIGSRRPNVLIILTDDQRLAGTMAVMPATRHWFGRGGTTFTHAFATTPLCCPSRASIFSGLYAHNHTVQNNQPGAESNFDFHTTMQASLHAAGYRTAIFGKYFNAWDLSEDPPSFDRWGIESPNGTTGFWGGTWNIDGRLRKVDEYSTRFIADRGVAFIRSSEADDARPWFLELATYAPHMPALDEARYRSAALPSFSMDPSMSEADLSDKPAYVQGRLRATAYGIEHARAMQLRSLMSVDDLVARVEAALRATGETRTTLAFFLSDNGELWGAHGITGKQTPYLPSVRVPMYARWPGHIGAGAVDGRLVANIDIAPTVLEAAAIDPAVTMDGRSLFDAWERNRMLLEYWRIKHPSDIPTWGALYTRRYEYVEYDVGGRIAFREYYDLRHDPFELTNLLDDGTASNDPDVAALHRRLAADRNCSGGSCP